jgi:hypothetical protein
VNAELGFVGSLLQTSCFRSVIVKLHYCVEESSALAQTGTCDSSERGAQTFYLVRASRHCRSGPAEVYLEDHTPYQWPLSSVLFSISDGEVTLLC